MTTGKNCGAEGRLKLLMSKIACGNMTAYMIYGNKGLGKRIGKRFCKAYTHKKRTYKPRKRGGGNSIYIIP